MKTKNIIVLSLVVLLGLGLTILTGLIFNPIALKIEKEKALEKTLLYYDKAKDVEVLTNKKMDGVSVSFGTKVYDKDDVGIGYLYEINKENDFGNIKLMVKVDLKDSISEIVILELNQTMYQSQTEKLVNDYVFTKLSNEVVDLSAGATSISLNTLSSMIKVLGSYHHDVEKLELSLPYLDYYGDYEVLETKNENKNGADIIIETISDDKGLVYSLTKAGIYQTGNAKETEITLVIILDNEGKVLKMLLPGELYKHSKGGFYDKALLHVEEFENMKLEMVPDTYTGASDPSSGVPFNTLNLIHDLIQTAKEIYLS